MYNGNITEHVMGIEYVQWEYYRTHWEYYRTHHGNGIGTMGILQNTTWE